MTFDPLAAEQSAAIYHESGLALVAAKAAQLDALPVSASAPTSTPVPCWKASSASGGGGGCTAALKVGFIQADASFSRVMCSSGPAAAAKYGIAIATKVDGSESGRAHARPRHPSDLMHAP